MSHIGRHLRVFAIGMALSFCISSTGCGGASGTWTGGIRARLAWSATTGLRVVEVVDGPAREAGLRDDDRIVEIDGRTIRTMSKTQVVAAMRGPVGSTVELKIARAGEPKPVSVTVQRVPYR